MASAAAAGNETPFGFGATESDRALSRWAPILLGIMSDPRPHRRLRRLAFEDDDNEDDMESDNHRPDREEESEVDRELGSIIRRRRSSATILQLLQGIRAGMASSQPENDTRERDTPDRDERVILINPFNQTIVVQGPFDSSININDDDSTHNAAQNQPIGSLGDYLLGPGLDLLLQHLAENDPNRYGTPPAQKEAVEALPTVKIKEALQCSVCLEDFEMGTEAKQMPCKHKFHEDCILPWLELHSSCPVCRFQLPWDESKVDDSNGSRSSSSNNNTSAEGGGGDGRSENGRRFSLPFPWPFSSLFSSLGSQSGNGNGDTNTSSLQPPPTPPPEEPSNGHAHPSASEANDN